MEPEVEQALNDQLNGREPQEVEAPEVEEVDAQEEVEVAAEVDDDEGPAPEPKLTRGEERFQKLANERAEAKSRADQAERERDFYRMQHEQAMARAQQPAQPEEELDPMVKWQRDTNQALQRSQFQTNDMLDQAKFTMELAKKPAYAPFADDVEKRLEQFRRAGGNPSRIQVLTVIAGEKALEKLEKAPALKREAQARVKAAQGTPLRTASNVAPGTKAAQSTYERLKDMPI